MGLYYYVHVGPYIEAPNPIKAGTREAKACTNSGCSKHKKETSDAFCSQCGGKIGTVTKNTNKRVSDTFSVYDECGERLSHVHNEWLPEDKQDSAIFLPNLNGFNRTFGDKEAAVVGFNETLIADDLARFKAAFAADIDRIREAFGNVIVQWGVVAYAS